jgi:ligand-binding sensor domain-containing protein
LPDNYIYSLAAEGNGTIWVGTWSSGLIKFDGTNWTLYNTSNSNLPDDRIYSIAIDGNGTKWLGTYTGGLVKFDGTDWTIFNGSNSDLSDDWIVSIAIDGNGTKWIGTFGSGLAAFNENGIPGLFVDEMLKANYVKVFPNPASTSICIEANTNDLLSILNLNGQELIVRQVSEPKTRIDISALPCGIYLVKLTGERSVQVGKIIKL